MPWRSYFEHQPSTASLEHGAWAIKCIITSQHKFLQSSQVMHNETPRFNNQFRFHAY